MIICPNKTVKICQLCQVLVKMAIKDILFYTQYKKQKILQKCNLCNFLMKNEIMKIIDIGINLMHRSFNEDREQVVQASIEAGMSPLIITGTSEKSSMLAADYASRYPGKLYSTAGVHPHDAKSCTPETIMNLEKLMRIQNDFLIFNSSYLV